MTTALTAELTAFAFAIAAWLGAVLADAWCANFTPHEDGPKPVAFPRWPFAVAAGIVGAMASLHGSPALHLAMLLVVVAALAGCAAADMRCGMIPDVFSLGALALVVGLGAFQHDWSPLIGAAIVALPFAAMALISRGRGMGWGDVKLAGVGGALLGAPDAMLAFIPASLAAYVIARRSGGARQPIAFGPYLAGSIILALTLEPPV
jgi:leader peptidase (prepilin peptidase) / N-methyltransferase